MCLDLKDTDRQAEAGTETRHATMVLATTKGNYLRYFSVD